MISNHSNGLIFPAQGITFLHLSPRAGLMGPVQDKIWILILTCQTFCLICARNSSKHLSFPTRFRRIKSTNTAFRMGAATVRACEPMLAVLDVSPVYVSAAPLTAFPETYVQLSGSGQREHRQRGRYTYHPKQPWS